MRVVPMLHVPDVRATAEWYASIGFTVERTHSDDDFMSWALLSFGETELMLNEGGRPSDAFRREVDLYVYVDDVDAVQSKIGDGADIVEPVHDTFYGMRELIIRDINRFWITFGQMIPNSGS